jgi:hypothetical protein
MRVISFPGVLVIGVVGIAACELDGSPTGVTVGTGTAPPTPSLTATTTMIGDSTQSPSLRVSAVVRNTTSVTLFIAGGGQCPLSIVIVPGTDTTSHASSSGSLNCSGAGAVQLAARDSVVFTQVISATALAGYQPGAYTVEVSVLSARSTDFTSGSYVTSVSAGAVELPLGQAAGVQP